MLCPVPTVGPWLSSQGWDFWRDLGLFHVLPSGPALRCSVQGVAKPVFKCFLFFFRESCGICNWSYVQYVGKLTRWRQSGALVQPSHPMSVNYDFADYVTAEITYAWWSPALCVVCLKSFTW